MTAERNPPGEGSLLARPLELLTTFALQAPGWVVAGALGLALVAVLVTCNGLEFKTSRLDLLNAKSAYNQRWLAFLDEFGDRDDAVVVVHAADPALLHKVIDDLGGQLRSQRKLFQSVMDRTDLTNLRGKALHFLPDEKLQQLQAETARASAMIPRDTRSADPGQSLALLNNTLEKVRAASPEARQQLHARYAEVTQSLQMMLQPPSATVARSADWSQLQEKFGADYLLSDQGNLGFVLCKLKIDPAEMARGKQAITVLREMIQTTRSRYPDAWIGLTGMPIIEYDEMQSSQADMLWTGILSMAFVATLFIAGYGGLRHALLACVVLQLGMAWSFGFVTLAIGHLNILSSAFGVVVIGQGIDFSVHYVSSYLKLRREGQNTAQALISTARDVGPGVFTGAISTAAAFFAAGFTEFTGIAELGIIGGAGILLCVLATAIVLPPLIYLVDHGRESLPLPVMLPAAQWFRAFTRHPSLTIASTLILTLALTGGVGWLRYDHNLLNLQPAHLESSEIERELFSKLDDSVWFAVSMCDTKEELQARKAAFEKLSQVAKTEEIGSLLPMQNSWRMTQVAAIHHAISDLPQRPATASIDVARLKREVVRANHLLERDATYETPLIRDLVTLSHLLYQQPENQLTAQLTYASTHLAAHALEPLKQLRDLSDPHLPTADDLPKELRDRYIGKTGKYLIKVYAKGNIWDLERLRQFVNQVETVDPRVTGHPVQTFYASQHMQWSYIYSGGYALLAVFLLLLLDFRNLRHTLLAMTPLGLGCVQMCGLLGWLDIPFNPANMIGLPLILGIGVDEGAHLVHEMRRQRGRFKLGDSTTIAIILTSVTTMAGFGTLILSRHQGLRSMGQLLTLGVGLCLACTVVFLPALLVQLTRSREEETIPSESEEKEARSLSEGEAGTCPASALTTKRDVPTLSEEKEARRVSEGDPQFDVAPLTRSVSKGEPRVDLLPHPTPAAPPATISYFRIDLPDPSPPADTLTLEILRAELEALQTIAKPIEAAPAPNIPQRLELQAPDFAPLAFGPVTTTVPRRRLIPRRIADADASQIGPVAGESDQVH
jgi:hopanoid biosynthesis associated RND transporter like protein HpnN